MTETMPRSVVHDTFSIERTYPVPVERVFAAWKTIEAKAQWFANDEGVEVVGTHTLDFRPGGTERFTAKAEGMTFEFAATYYDIVGDERIVWAYDMLMDGRRISASLATVELAPVAGGTKLVLTEQGAYLDGLDTNAQRAEGTEQFLNNLGSYLTGS
jgi:uncharacterized protein YndB with AHSA1/START domain